MRELCLILGFLTLFSLTTHGQQVYLMDFENVTNGVEYTTSISECRGTGGFIYFGVIPDSLVSDTTQGKFFATQTISASPCNATSGVAKIEFTGIDISKIKNKLELSVLASRNRSENQWEGSSYFHIDYQIDGGGYQNGLWIESDGSNGGSKGVPALDADNDGLGESTKLGNSFQEFTKVLSGRGNSLDIRITYNRFVTKVDLNFDDLKISETEEAIDPLSKLLPYAVDFEDEKAGVDYYTSIDECSDDDVWFGVFTDSLNIDSGNKYFTVQNVESAPCSSPTGKDTLIFSGIPIGEVTDILKLAIDLGEATDETDEWDADSFFHLDYQVDGNGYNNGIWVEANGDGQAAIDSDFNGTGDDTHLLNRFDTFTKFLDVSGDTLDLRIIVGGMNEFGEEIGFDKIKVEEVSALAKALPYIVDFEDEVSGLDYVTSMGECADLENDVFFGVIEDSESMISNNDGSFFGGHLITDSPCASTDGEETVTFEGIDISELTGFLKISADLAVMEVSPSVWEPDTYVHIDYQVDGEGYQPAIWVDRDGTLPAIDILFEEFGTGTKIDSLFNTFSRHFEVSGDSLDLRITYSGMNAQGIDLAIDNIKVEEVTEVAKTIPYSLEFDTDLNGLHYTTSMEECADGTEIYFGQISSESNVLTEGDVDLIGFGARAFTESPCNSSDGIETIFITDIDISSITENLKLILDAGKDLSVDWEESDFLHIDYQIDGGGYQNAIWFEANAQNDDILRDYNFDGVADSTQLDYFLKEYSQVLSGSGSTLDLRITVSLNGADKYVFFDNLKVEETSEEPEAEPVAETSEQEVLYLMDFENVTEGVDYTASFEECSNGSNIYLGIFTVEDVSRTSNANGLEGAFFGANSFRKSPCNGSFGVDTLLISGIDISSAEEFFLSVDLARVPDGGGFKQWLGGSYLHLDYQIDNGGFQNGIWVEGSEASAKGTANIDTDFDGVGDGQGINAGLSTYATDYISSGSTIDIRITLQSFLDDVDIIVDNISLFEVHRTTITGGEGWRLLSSAISDDTYEEFLEPIWTQGIASGADVTNGSPNVFTYSNDSDAFTALTDLSQKMTPGQGFAVYVYADDDFDGSADAFPKVLRQSGVKNNGDIIPALNKGDDGDAAFSLLGNPYTTQLDWDLLTRNDLNGVVYVYDPSIPGYKTWNGTTGALTNGIIDPYTGFWVENSGAGNPMVLMQDNDKVSVKTVGSGISLSLMAEVNGLQSSTYFSFSDSASITRDVFDAHKLTLLDFKPYVSLASRIGEGLFDINNLPADFEEEITIPLNFAAYTTGETGWVEQSGEVTLSWGNLENVPEEWSVILTDLVTGERIDLKSKDEYTFHFEATKAKTKATKNASVLLPVSAQQETALSADRFTLSISNTGTSVGGEPDETPAQFALSQNYPNPFNPTTVINYQLPVNSRVKLQVFDMLGREVATLVDEQKSAGSYNVSWNAANLASGIYIYRLQAGANVFTRKMTLIK